MSVIQPTILKLQTNSKGVFEEVTRLLIKIADNILKEPTNLKIRKLQKSNATISKKILSINGGLECLQVMGFEENETHLILPPSACLNKLQTVREEISFHHSESLKQTSEPNAFLGLVENSPLEDSAMSNHCDASSTIANVDSSSEDSSLSSVESESENEVNQTISSSQGAIPKVLRQPGEQSKGNLNTSNLRQMTIIPSDVPKVHLPPLVYIFSNPFLRGMELAFHMALAYDDQALKQHAKSIIPVERLEVAAQKRLRLLQEQIKKDKREDIDISIQDMLILELLSWFKNEFFTWVDTLDCQYCGGKTTFSHMSDDSALKIHTERVEMHKCNQCQQFTPFPRYNDVNILLLTRKGRCGEWANTFTLLCCAMGWDARHVVDQGDHVWTEVYSFAQKRWLHCDPCEDVCDTPLMYENGWGKKLTYVMAYSPEDVQDVTWHYSSHHKAVLARRNLCSEAELINALLELRKKRQENISQSRKEYLTRRTAIELAEMLLEKKPTEADKQGRTSGSLAWRLTRGEIQEDARSSYVWTMTKNETKFGNITLRYSAALNTYEYVLGNGTVKIKFDEWQKGAFSSTDIFRKEEKDWKMVYLARREGANRGNIKWKFVLDDPDKVFHTVTVKCNHQVYENGNVEIQVEHDNNNIPISDPQETTNVLISGATTTCINVNLSGGRGDVAWQHAQLFRQHVDSKDYPFSVTFSFKDRK